MSHITNIHNVRYKESYLNETFYVSYCGYFYT